MTKNKYEENFAPEPMTAEERIEANKKARFPWGDIFTSIGMIFVLGGFVLMANDSDIGTTFFWSGVAIYALGWCFYD